MSTIEKYLEENADRFEAELCELLRIPSVSADPAYKSDMVRAADWMIDRFKKLGFATEKIEGDGHPIVYAESPKIEGAPTVLVYGHYDVQPPDPLDKWVSPPFEPQVRDGCLYARGATDDKGQMMTHVFSAEAVIACEGKLPINLKYAIEGEEEAGGNLIDKYLETNPEHFACDCVVVSDMSQFGPGQPAITYGLRGIATFELTLTGPNRDLHSGAFGGAVTNPANALTKLMGQMIDERGKVQIPGFYDDVKSISEAERSQMAMLPFTKEQFYQSVGVDGAVGESGFSPIEQKWIRPTLDINGITSGYQGEGSKTIIPSTASVKFSCRMVPDQDPEKISQSLRTWLDENCPAGITYDLVYEFGSRGFVVPIESQYVGAAAKAVEHAFGRSPVLIREGGSIPIVATMHKALGAEVLMLGWGQNDDNLHSPNEKFNLSNLHRGTKASARLWQEMSRLE